MEEVQANAFGDTVRDFLSVISKDEEVSWRDVPVTAYESVGDLLELIVEAA